MMNDPLYFAVHNTFAALILALIVAAVTRVWRHPPLAHVLWLLVLVKLVVPPVVPLDVAPIPPDLFPDASVAPLTQPELEPATRDGGVDVVSSSPTGFESGPDSACLVVRHTTDRAIPESSVSRNTAPVLAWFSMVTWDAVRTALLGIWLGGAATCAALVLRRIVQFERLLADSLPPPEHLERIVRETAASFGLKRVPRVAYAASIDVPLVWWAGGEATVVLPVQLFRRLDDDRARLIIAHELAHLARRDHWVRVLETLVTTLCWWNPLAWLVRRRIHDVEDLCCDAWVRQAFPQSERSYAEVVLKTAEMVGASCANRPLPAASPFFHSLSLKARIEMILKGRFAPVISTKSMVFVALFTGLVVPSFVPSRETEAQSVSNAKAPEPSKEEVTNGRSDNAGPAETGEFPDDTHIGAPRRRGVNNVARVGKRYISYEELATECVSRSGSEVLEALVNREIIKQACDARNIEVSESEVTAEIDRIAKKFGLNRESWLAQLQSERNLTRQRYRNDVIWPTLALRKLAGVDITLTPDQVKKTYRDYGPRVKARAIFLDNQRRANEVWEKVHTRPQDFAHLAREHSIDEASRQLNGVIAPIPRYAGAEALENAAFNLKEGEISGVIQVGLNQFVILKCEGRILRDEAEFREMCRPELHEERVQQAVDRILEKLKREASIEKDFSRYSPRREWQPTPTGGGADSVTRTWKDDQGSLRVERWASDRDGSLKLVELTKSGTDLSLVDATDSASTDVPSPQEVLRALSDDTKAGPSFVSKTARSNVRIVAEKIVDKLDDARFYPMVGPARKRSRHYKCTVTYDKVTRSDWPVPYSHTEPNVVDVVYVDHDHLIRASGPN